MIRNIFLLKKKMAGIEVQTLGCCSVKIAFSKDMRDVKLGKKMRVMSIMIVL